MDQSLAEVHPKGRDVDLAREALILMRPVLDNPGLAGDEPVTITVEGGPDAIVVPKSVFELLVRVLGGLSAGEGITVVPSHAELTTQQAADLLNVSRPHLVKPLSEGQIEFRSVGTHRRVLARSLMEYVKADDQRRLEAAAEPTRLGQEMSFI